MILPPPVVTLSALGHYASPLLDGLEKRIRFNHQRFGLAVSEGRYPTLTRRKAVARAMEERLGWAQRAGVSDRR